MELRMMNIREKLIEGYIKSPPPLKEQTITRVAILLCQKFQLKKYLFFETEELRRCKYSISNGEWGQAIEVESTDMCQKLPLPTALKELLIVRIRPIASHLFSWNRQQAMFKLSPIVADSFLTPADWTVEMKLDEKKIAERLVQDKRIPVWQRFKIACYYFLESFIHSLWDQIPAERRDDLFRNNDSKLFQLWSYKLAGRVEELIPNEDLFWFNLWVYGFEEASESTVFNCWGKLHISLRQESLIKVAAMTAVYKIYNRIQNNSVFLYSQLIPSPAPYSSILCFLLTQMSEEQKVVFFQEALRDSRNNVLVCFLKWPYLDLLIPVIKKLWNILPEAKYEDLLFTIANNYSKYTFRHDYVDYEFGHLIIELLRGAPNNFKRYVFGDHYHMDKSVENGKLFDIVVSNRTYTVRTINIFLHIWKYATFEEKRSFLRSKYGECFCCYLAYHDNWELLNSIVRECSPEEDVAIFQRNILKSESGKCLYLLMLREDNEKRLNSWFNWGFSSKQEIFSFILKTIFKFRRIDFKKVYNFGISIDLLDNVIKMYSPSEDATKKFKTRFVKIYSRSVCIDFVRHSKWQNIDEFLIWGLPVESARKRFKEWFVREYAMHLCGYHIGISNLQDAENFLTWCFPSEEAVKQFKQELFFFSGVQFQWNLFRSNSSQFDSLMEWSKLSPGAIHKFKKEMFFCSYSLNYIFTVLSECEKYRITYHAYSKAQLKNLAFFLKWGLENAETVTALRNTSLIYLMNFSFSNDEARQWVRQNWDTLISDIHSELLIERKHETRVKDIKLFKQRTIV